MDRTGRRLPRHVVVVLLLALGLAGLGTAALSAVPLLPAPSDLPFTLSWPLLALLLASAQSAVLNVQLGHEARAVFLSEIPFALGLAFAAADDLVLARLAAALVVQGALNRQYRKPLKLVFNLAVAYLEAAIGLLVFRLVLDGGSPAHLHGSLALEVANVAASCAAGLAVAVVIQLVERRTDLPGLTGVARSAALQAMLVSSLGCVAVVSLAADPWSGVVLSATGGALFLAYRAYSSLNERHLGLERVYRFTQVVASSPEMSQVLAGVLEQARELLHADRALVTFVQGENGGAVEVTRGRTGGLERGPAQVLDLREDPVVARAFSGDGAVLLSRAAREAGVRDWLERRGLRELLAVPLRGDAGVIGVLSVTDRIGEARGFDAEDARLLETVANHAAIALRNGRLVDQLRHESLHDALTGLPNRAFFHRELDQRLAALPTSGQLVVGVLDLDNFKDVNDTLGHARGDDLLREVSARLVGVAQERAVVARLGGDEFAVVFAAADEDSAVRFGRAMVTALHQPVLLGGVEVEVGGSLGLALTGTSGTERAALLKHADMAMYSAKQAGYDVTLYDDSLDRTAPSRLAMVGRLRSCIAAGQLEVHVQPQACLVSGAVVGVEALVRWHDSEFGDVPPDEFIPLAERSGLIRPLTDLVLRRSVEMCAAWQRELPGVGIAVNLSLRSLTDDAVVEQADRLLRQYLLPPGLLTLEITESSIMTDPATTLDVLHRLRDLGVRLSIDDFGTGYSSLSYLRRLPVSELKIDRSFVAGIARDADDAAVARSIVDLASGMGLRVVAEGVEDVAAWEAVRALGCPVAQGNLISRPVPCADFLVWHRTWRSPARGLTAV